MMSESSLRNWWDREAEADVRYKTLAWGGDGTPEQVQPTIDAILENLEIFMTDDWPVKDVWEIGCGPGRLLRRFAAAHPEREFFGSDISQAMLDLGGEWPANVTVGLNDEPMFMCDVGLVYSVEVMQHLEPDDVDFWLRWAVSVLCEGGVALVQYVVGVDDGVWMCHPIQAQAIEKMACDAGFTVLPVVLDRVHDDWGWLVLQK